jgi:hypothetical protein
MLDKTFHHLLPLRPLPDLTVWTDIAIERRTRDIERLANLRHLDSAVAEELRRHLHLLRRHLPFAAADPSPRTRGLQTG